MRAAAARAKDANMAHARILQRIKNTMQSGKARAGGWLVEFASERPQHADPLTGWAGGQETQAQVVGLNFPTVEAAIDYCERHGHSFTVVPTQKASLKLQAYADNFK
jgi:hypothetical protein